MQETNQHTSFFSPIYWPAWILIGILWFLSKLPYRAQLFLGKWLGILIYQFNTRMKHIAKVNIHLCFPKLSEAEKTSLLKKNFISIGIGVFETCLAWWGSNSQLKKLAHFHNFEVIQKALSLGKGVILMGEHFTSLEIVGRLCSSQFPFSVIYRKHKIAFVENFISKAYKKYYAQPIERHDVRSTLRRLKRGEIVWFTPDVDAGHFHNVFVPFFGIRASSLIASSRLPAITGAKVIPAYFYRRDDGTGYDITASDPLEDFPTGEVEADVARVNQMQENFIRKKPEQYMWQYMRFKTRPEGEKRFYSTKS